jgi:serine/threonine protein kinase
MKDFFVSGLQQKAYLVLEKVYGQTLQQVIKDKKRLEITLAKKLFFQLLQAVSYLH